MYSLRVMAMEMPVYSLFTWEATPVPRLLSIAVPGKATLRDITFRGNAAVTNILITDADQKGSRVFLQEFRQAGGQVGMIAKRA